VSTKCDLRVPYKSGAIGERECEINLRRIQDWADQIMRNGCCCSGPATANRTKCFLNIPHMRRPSLIQMEANFRELTQWSQRWEAGECCTCVNAGDSCLLHIPYTRMLNDAYLAADFRRIERWAYRFVRECCTCGCVWGVTEVGTLTRTFPQSLAVTAADLWCTYAGGGGNVGIGRFTYPGLVAVGGFPAYTLRAGSIGTFGITTDNAGNVFYADSTAASTVIYKIDTSYTRTTLGTYAGVEFNSMAYFNGVLYCGDGSATANLYAVNATTGASSTFDTSFSGGLLWVVSTPTGIMVHDDAGGDPIYAYNALPATTRTTADTGAAPGLAPMIGNSRAYYQKGIFPKTSHSVEISPVHTPITDPILSSLSNQGDSHYAGTLYGKDDLCITYEGSTIWEGACGNTEEAPL